MNAEDYDWYQTAYRMCNNKILDGFRIIATSEDDAIAREHKQFALLESPYKELLAAGLVKSVWAAKVPDEVWQKYDMNREADLFHARARDNFSPFI